MIDNIVITHICTAGNHARITFDVDGVPDVANNLEYSPFFEWDFSSDRKMEDLRYLLNQHSHSSWGELKSSLEG